jgi:L,D-transpeptidase-like protein
VRRPLGQFATAVLVLLAGLAPAVAQDEAPPSLVSPCPDRGEVVIVSTETRELWLCGDGVADARFVIALGRNGVGKRRQGDGRTPLGTYALGDPRPSNQYGTFIPIQYPRPDQAARGFSGSHVGIHGPPRGVSYAAVGIDWTLGCIATGTDVEVEAIAEWVRERRPVLVIR